MADATIYIVEDDPDLREAIEVTLTLKGIQFQTFSNAEEALHALSPNFSGVLITDFRLPGMNGIELLKAALRIRPNLPCVVMTAYADAKLAVEALKSGARDFLIKPFVPEQLVEVIHRYQESPANDGKKSGGPEVIVTDPATFAVLGRCERVAKTEATVLLLGESGVGKDIFARQIHELSARAHKPYVALNCAAIPETLLESTLFGHEKGAFTGATKTQEGKFEQADGGTLFLDEIGELHPELQAKLLRVLQDKTVERLGGRQSIACDVRIIAATNKDLQARVADGKFREDLYFRLAVFPIRIPNLSERPKDIRPLAEAFVRKYGVTMGRPHARLGDAAYAKLESYFWPGNVRELENAIQRALLLSDHDLIYAEHFELDAHAGTKFAFTPTQAISFSAATSPEPTPQATDIGSLEREHILKVLTEVNGHRKKAVAILGISERALRYKLKSYREAGFEFE